MLNGIERPDAEQVDRRRQKSEFGYEPKAIVDSDGSGPQPGGGGVDTVQLALPIRNIVENTRLGNDLAQGEILPEQPNESRVARPGTDGESLHTEASQTQKLPISS